MDILRESTYYYIPPGRFLLTENALGNPDLIQSSVSSDCEVTIMDKVNFPLDELEQWPVFKLVTTDILLKGGSDRYNIYISVPTAENKEVRKASIGYTTKTIDVDGYEVLPDGGKGNLIGAANFKYYKAGLVYQQGSNPGAETTPEDRGRFLDFDLGTTPPISTLPGNLSDYEEIFEIDKVDPSNPFSWLLTIVPTIKTATARTLNVTQKLVFGTGDKTREVTDIAIRIDADDETKIGDSILASTAWVYASIGDLGEKFIRKDQPDETIHSVDFMGGLSINSKRIGDLIRYYDDPREEPTDANIYSALMTNERIEEEVGALDDRFLRKDKEDFAHKHITFEEGITVYELAEMMNLEVKNLATIAKAVVSILRSSKFVDGFSGEGYQIWQDIASGDWNLTIDRLTVRKVMTIYELIIQKIRSVGGMVAVSAANGKVKTVDKIGNQYLFTFEDANQFQPNDLMRCQVFTGKDVKYYWVKVATVSGESVMVPVSEFAGVVPAVGDECVLMGNTTNKRRQSLIIISAAEDGQPRFDCLNGVKTKSFEGCLKVRVGNLDGISDSRFPENMQPSGHGLYGNNCFLTGIFVLSNGKDVMTMFSIMEGMIKSEISSVRNEINEKDNYLSNAAFSESIAGWQGNSNIRIFSVNGKLLMFNHNFYANKEAFANIVSRDAKNVLRLKNSSITQLNADFSKKPVFDEYVQEDAEGNPILDANGNPVKLMRPRMFYVSFRYMVTRPGTLKVYFKNENTAGFEPYTSINYSEYIEAGNEFKVMEIAGKWDGTGDFFLSFSGDMYLFSLALADNRLADMEEKFNSRFELTDKKLQVNFDEIKKTGEKLEEYHSEFLFTAREMQIKFTEDLFDSESNITEAYRSHVSFTARELQVGFTAEIENSETRVTEAYTGAISMSAQGLETKFTKDITDMEDGITAAYKGYFKVEADGMTGAFEKKLVDLKDGITDEYKGYFKVESEGLTSEFNRQIKDINGVLEEHTGKFTVTTDEISALVTATNNIDNTIKTAGWITNIEANRLFVQNGDIISSINQTAESVSIDASKINLNGTVTANGYFKIHLDGSMEATSGTIGGFTIASNRIGSVASSSGGGGGLSIYDDLFRVGGSDGYVLFGNDVMPSILGGAFTAVGRVVNKAANSMGGHGYETSNYGLFLDVTGGTKNYGISSNAPLLAPAFIGTKVARLTLSGGNSGIDFSQSAIFIVKATVSVNFLLPNEASICSQFGLRSLPANFGFEFVLVADKGTQQIAVKNVYGHNFELADYYLWEGDALRILCTNATSQRGMIYKSVHYDV